MYQGWFPRAASPQKFTGPQTASELATNSEHIMVICFKITVAIIACWAWCSPMQVNPSPSDTVACLKFAPGKDFFSAGTWDNSVYVYQYQKQNLEIRSRWDSSVQILSKQSEQELQRRDVTRNFMSFFSDALACYTECWTLSNPVRWCNLQPIPILKLCYPNAGAQMAEKFSRVRSTRQVCCDLRNRGII